MILPHDFVAWMYKWFPQQFHMRMLGGNSPADVSRWWQAFRPDDDVIWSHPALRHKDGLPMLAPLSQHCDGVPFTAAGAGSKSLICCSVSSPLGIGATLDTHWLSGAFPSDICHRPTPRFNQTLDPYYDEFNWSMKALNDGTHPWEDSDGEKCVKGRRAELAGTPIAGGWRFLNFQQRGDLDMFSNELGLSHWSQTMPCFKCPANRTDFRKFAKKQSWKLKCYSDVDWLRPACKFWHGPGVSRRTAALDTAHTLDKGVSEKVLGSIFKELVYDHALCRGPLSSQLACLWELMRKYYQDNNIEDRINCLELKDFCVPGAPHRNYPHFNPGNMTKVRVLIPFGRLLAHQFNTGSRRDAHRQELMDNLCRIYDIILTAPDHLPDDMLHEFQDCIDAFLAHQTWLHNDGQTRGEYVYSVTIKSHYLWHIGQDAKWYNPRLGWCYADEDFVGKIAALGRSVTRATTSVKRGKLVLAKYAMALAVRWQKQQA